jgi:dihydroorotate dehydrogenase
VTAYARLVRPLLFRLDPERSHELAVGGLAAASRLGIAGRVPPVRRPRLAQHLMGLVFPTPLGLAAGFDKRARAIAGWEALGFGHCEVGTVTPRPQAGNPAPRLFRLPADAALINRLGFNNDGAERTARRMAAMRDRRRIPVGVNIGKSRDTPAEEAAADYAAAADMLWPHADYLTINVSSPNTVGLRDLQATAALGDILAAVGAVNRRHAAATGRPERPVLVKVAPDLAPEDLDAVVDLAIERGATGLIVTNTTIGRDGLVSPPHLVAETGGLSGRPLRARATAVTWRVARRAEGRLVVVAAGGIADADDAWDRLAAGASLLQLYTALVYEGPGLPRRIARGLVERMDREGVAHISEVVGSGLGSGGDAPAL